MENLTKQIKMGAINTKVFLSILNFALFKQYTVNSIIRSFFLNYCENFETF